jgi:hypothetical protein
MKYSYELKRSSRRTLCVSISSDNKITVYSPRRTSVAEIEKFLLSKSDWLDKKIKKNSIIISHSQDVLSFKSVLVNGNVLPLYIGKENKIEPNCVQVINLNYLPQVYVNNFGKDFLNNFEMLSSKLNLKANSVKFKDYKSRWGCCDCKNNIIFNYKLLMLPIKMQEYVIIHELCHIAQHNHSAEFWALVQTFCPDWKAIRKQLKSYSYLNTLYA